MATLSPLRSRCGRLRARPLLTSSYGTQATFSSGVLSEVTEPGERSRAARGPGDLTPPRPGYGTTWRLAADSPRSAMYDSTEPRSPPHGVNPITYVPVGSPELPSTVLPPPRPVPPPSAPQPRAHSLPGILAPERRLHGQTENEKRRSCTP